MVDISINIVFEDILSEVVLRKLLRNSKQNYIIGTAYRGGGKGWIEKRINGFNNAAKGMPYLVLTDLDQEKCAPEMTNRWLKGSKHPNLLLRVAVKEVESWILGCRSAFAGFVGIRQELIPTDVDAIENTKEFLVGLVSKSRRKDIRRDIVPRIGSTAKVGPDYNGRLICFVENFWDPDCAKKNSPSLRRTIEVLSQFQPIWESE